VCLAWYTPALAARCLYVSSYHPGSVADSLVQGTAAAFQTTASVKGWVISLPVYVDTDSASTKLVAGIYKEKQWASGHSVGSGDVEFACGGDLEQGAAARQRDGGIEGCFVIGGFEFSAHVPSVRCVSACGQRVLSDRLLA
jgi:hypothetical protein